MSIKPTAALADPPSPPTPSPSPAPVPSPNPSPAPEATPAPAPAPDAPAPVATTPAAEAPTPKIEIELDYADAQDLQEWAEKAKAICEEWYPKICAELASEGFTPPTSTRITFDPAMRGVAHTSRGRIRASAAYVRDHKDDYGMMVHELVHVVQSYPTRPKRAPSWIVEGIADYIRFHKYEPGADKSRINPEKASYRDSYRTTARFFAWAVENHDKEIIQKLNAALRKGECDEEKAKELFGGDIDTLWARFLDEKVRG
jgi:hypothetical protein